MNPPEDWYGHPGVAEVVTTYRCASCGRKMLRADDGEWRHEPRMSDHEAFRRAGIVRTRAAALAEAVPYSGAIRDCQAAVTRDEGRWTSHGRCRFRARYVVVRQDRGLRAVELLAVCRIHAKDSGSYRFIERGSASERSVTGAIEQVEPEYVLAGDGVEHLVDTVRPGV